MFRSLYSWQTEGLESFVKARSSPAALCCLGRNLHAMKARKAVELPQHVVVLEYQGGPFMGPESIPARDPLIWILLIAKASHRLNTLL